VSEDFDAATDGLGDGGRAFLKTTCVGTAFGPNQTVTAPPDE
jgi:hypothetical protein